MSSLKQTLQHAALAGAIVAGATSTAMAHDETSNLDQPQKTDDRVLCTVFFDLAQRMDDLHRVRQQLQNSRELAQRLSYNAQNVVQNIGEGSQAAGPAQEASYNAQELNNNMDQTISDLDSQIYETEGTQYTVTEELQKRVGEEVRPWMYCEELGL